MYWLSFADPQKPAGQQFLGCLIMYQDELGTAAIWAHVLGINPGGEVLGVQFDDPGNIPEEFIERLLNKEDVARFDQLMKARTL